MELWSSLFGRKTTLLDFELIPRPQPNFKEDQYPLLLISNLLDTPRNAWVYTKINLQHMYHPGCISPGDEWKTAFQTHYVSFEWLVIPEGLTNSPAAFQRFIMNDIFTDMIDIIVIIYLDDILIYSNNISEQKAHILEVLHRLHTNRLFSHADKCKFHITSCE